MANSSVAFQWMTYRQIWEERSTVPVLVPCAESLLARYEAAELAGASEPKHVVANLLRH
jgi:hypothetical protein